MGVCMTTTRSVKRIVKILKGEGCQVEANWPAGTVKIYYAETSASIAQAIYSCIQKGRNGNWIVRYEDSKDGRFKWTGSLEEHNGELHIGKKEV